MKRTGQTTRRCALTVGAVLISGALFSCQLGAEQYVVDAHGYTTLRGKVTSVRKLSADVIEHLADGFALTISESGCEVDIRFNEDKSSTETLQKGSMIVFGSGSDFLLRPPSSSSAAPPPEPEPAPAE